MSKRNGFTSLRFAMDSRQKLQCWYYVPNINDPTAGSPTVTLLRLLLPPIVLVQ